MLFPGGPLALRIFEPRYLDMVRRCFKDQSGFGVTTILEGEEAGAVTRLATTGTLARLVDFDPLPDGLLGITCLGGGALSRAAALAAAGWPQLRGGRSTWRRKHPASCRWSSRTWPTCCAKCLPKLGRGYAHVAAHYEDAGWVANRWAEVLPLNSEEKLALLELDAPLERLALVAAWSARQPPAAHV